MCVFAYLFIFFVFNYVCLFLVLISVDLFFSFFCLSVSV